MAEKKKWAVLHYLVAVTDGNPQADEHLRKHALTEIADILKAGQGRLADMHVAYQIEHWKIVNGHPQKTRIAKRAKVTSSTSLPVEEPVTPLEDAANKPRRGDDLRAFFEWVTNATGSGHCPADHIAVFFWGHSAGPAGIFDLLDGGKLPPFTLVQRTARLLFNGLGHKRASRLGERIAEVALPVLSGAFTALQQRCDLIAFKDCWMSTGEVACELAEHVGAVIASQSQVPIAGVWPYPDIYQSLASVPGASAPGPIPAPAFTPVFDILVDMYASPQARGAVNGGQPAFPSVPLSLLDLSDVSGIQPAISALVLAIGESGGSSQAQKDCRQAFEQASTGFLPNAAGDIALVDVDTLCDALQAFPVAALPAKQVKQAFGRIRVKAESIPKAPNCTGVSLFYRPTTHRIANTPDTIQSSAGPFKNHFVLTAVRSSPYSGLRLNVLPKSWFDIAFEQR